MAFQQKNTRIAGSWLVVVFALLVINFVAANVHERLDLTNEKRFTISSPVKKLLGRLTDNVNVDIFLKGDLPAGFRNLSASAQELLQEFMEYSHGRVHLRVVSPDDPFPGTARTYADTLSALGFVPINLKVQLKAGEQSQYVYPAAMVSYRGRMIPVNLYSGTETVITPSELNSSEALLEYKFASAIDRLVENQKPLIAYSVGNGEPTGNEVYDLVTNVLQKNYALFTLDIGKQPVIPDTFRLLMIVKPTVPFTGEEKLKIDQYVMHGGKVLLFIDRLNAEMDSLQIKNQVIAYDRGLQLDDLLFKYGVRINPDLILDLQSDFLPFDVNGNKQFDFLHWNYFPLFESKQNSVINRNIGLVAGRFVNSIDTVNAPAIQKTILLSSSGNARIVATPALISGTENRNAPEDEAFKMKDIPAAVLLTGKFSSLYKNRVSTAVMDSFAGHNEPFLTRCINDNKMIVVADGDIPLNGTYEDKPLPMGVNSYTVGTQYQYQFANRDFVENCLEYLVNNDDLSEARAKDYTLRLLDARKVEEQRQRWQWFNLGVPLALVILFGACYQWWRRKKYTVPAAAASNP